METQLPPSDGGKEDPLAAIKESRQQLVSRIEALHNTQIELIASLQTLVPNLVPNLDLSQKTISAFNARPFTPLPAPLPAPTTKINARVRIEPVVVTKKLKASPEKSVSDGLPADDCGGSPVFPRSRRGMQGRVGVPPPMRTPIMGSNGVSAFKPQTEEESMKEAEALLNTKSFKEKEKSKAGEELLDLLHCPTVKEKKKAEMFKTIGGSQVKEYCKSSTKEDCRRQSGSYIACEKVHFRRIIALHTDVNLGNCNFLNTCRHMKTCKYVHYEIDSTPDMSLVPLTPPKPLKRQREHYCSEKELGESQWINCDIRSFRMDILGHFGVIMADPPWDIHMELPYGTMADDEMRTLDVPALQTDGLIFLWVTGRAMELGRECLELWGYTRTEEIIWVKTNQLQQIIRTGRTGHWLNHSKEHCLVGIKGNPDVNRNIDTDVLVAEVRETSRKPDEMYSLLERIMPGARKLELFARIHNCHPGWMSLGNQLNGVRLVDDGLRARFKAAYPDVEVQPASPPRSSAMDVDPVPPPPARTSSGQGDRKTSGAPPAEPTPAIIPPVPQFRSQEKAANLDVEMTA